MVLGGLIVLLPSMMAVATLPLSQADTVYGVCAFLFFVGIARGLATFSLRTLRFSVVGPSANNLEYRNSALRLLGLVNR